jgi:transcriptional regulator with XRE-family HTH domain
MLIPIILVYVENMSAPVENLSGNVNRLFGEQLATARRSRRVTQTELANRIGRSRVTVVNLESGKQNVQLHQIFTLAEALNVPVSELIPEPAAVYKDLQMSISDSFIQLTKSRLSSLLGGSE